MTIFDMEDAWYKPLASARIVTEKKTYSVYHEDKSPLYAICFPQGISKSIGLNYRLNENGYPMS
jgi:hypothetical protein